MSRKEIIGILGLLVAILACVATLLTVPQIGAFFFNKKVAETSTEPQKDLDSLGTQSRTNNDSPIPVVVLKEEMDLKDTVLNLPSREYKFSHTGSGDHNLNIDENNPLYYHCSAMINVVENSFLRSNIYVRISERKEDYTAGEVKEKETIYTAESGWEILSFGPLEASEMRGEHNNNRPGFGIETLKPKQSVEKFWIKGDHYGDDIPGYSSVEIIWRPITIKLIRKKMQINH